jgi:hypothetical protein
MACFRAPIAIPVADFLDADFLDIARLQEPNPLLYRLFPLTCARSQE